MQDVDTTTLPIEAVFADTAHRTLSVQALELFFHSFRQSAIRNGASFQGEPAPTPGQITQNFSYCGREYRLTLHANMQVSYQVWEGGHWHPSPDGPFRRLVIIDELFEKMRRERN